MVLFLLLFSLFCWGSWANTFKLAGNYRFEMYYVDFAAGFLLIALVLAFTAGNMGFDGFQFLDDFEHAGKRQWLFGFLAGLIFNLGNMLLVGSMSVAGMSIAFPLTIATALIEGSLLTFFIKSEGSTLLLLAGCALLAAAVVVGSIIYNIMGVIRHEQMARAGKAKSTRRPTSVKGAILAAAGGLVMGFSAPLVQKGMETEVGLGPYSMTFLIGLGVFASTVLFSVFFLNLPIEGEPLEPLQYFQGTVRGHALGGLGGAIACLGCASGLIAASAPAGAQAAPLLNNLFPQAYPLLAALWGILVWRELRNGDTRVRMGSVVMLLLFAVGLLLISLAPTYLHKA